MWSSRYRRCGWCAAGVILAVGCWWAGQAGGVQTQYVEHRTEEQFKKGEPNGVLISSEGVLTLAPQAKRVGLGGAVGAEWVVNAVLEGPDAGVYAATSGKGYVYRLRDGQAPEVIYGGGDQDARHVFSLAWDAQGRLLAGTGGKTGQLLRYEGEPGKWQELWSDQETKYIWSIAVGPAGRIYLGTGPEGKVWTLDEQGRHAELVYDAKAKNILCLALNKEGILYAGGDEGGLVYRIDPGSREARIAYDTGRAEVSGLVFDEAGNLYAATADVGAARAGAKLILSDGRGGRPETRGFRPPPLEPQGPELTGQQKAKPQEQPPAGAGGQDKAKANEASAGQPAGPAPPAESGKPAAGARAGNTPQRAGGSQKLVPPATGAAEPPAPGAPEEPKSRPAPPPPSGRGPRPAAGANEVFKITPDGYVTSVFSKPVTILALACAGGGSLLLGTGNEGQLLRLDVARQEAVALYEARPSAQVSALGLGAGGRVYAGLANPAGVALLGTGYAPQGRYESAAVDAGQVTRWGKLQVEAEAPAGTGLFYATRSGNTEDPLKGGWGPWSEARELKEDAAVEAGPARFLQYRLVLRSTDGQETPAVRGVKLAYQTPNLPPRLEQVEVKPPGPDSAAAAAGGAAGPGAATGAPQGFLVSWKAADANNDKLQFAVYVRPVGRERWVRLAKELEKSPYKWDSRTVADGRYEVKVEASDALSNPAGEGLTDSRVSREVVVDNTPPEVRLLTWELQASRATARVELQDQLSAIGGVAYSLDSAEKWTPVAAADGVYDSRTEAAELTLEKLEPGEHLLSIRYDDALGNRAYRNLTFEVKP